MNKVIGLVLLLLISVAVADQYDHASDRNGPCGKYSTVRVLTAKLRHCKKAARDLYAPVSPQCCNDLRDVSIACLYAVVFSDAFKNFDVNPHIALTVPERCLHTYHDPPATAHP